MWMIQLIDECKSQQEAQQVLEGITCQSAYMAGRILPPSAGKPTWRVQGFFVDVPEAQWLPDGLRRVFLPAWHHVGL